jgi:branched-chain amino acid transport system permease protein
LLDNVLQLTVNGIVNGTSYALLGIAFGLILGVSGRFHVAFTTTYALAAYVAAWLGMIAGMPFWLAVLAGGLAAAILGALMERFVYGPLSLRAGSNALLMIFVASLALSIIGRNTLAITSMTTTSLPINGFTNAGINVGPVTISSLSITMVLTSWVLIALLALVLARTSLGRMIRGVRANWEMALCVGIDPRAIYVTVFAIGSFLGGVGAVFAATQTSATPDMGLTPFFYALTIAFLAGLASPPLTVAIVGIALGLIESLSALFLPTQWTLLVVFAILFFYVALRPVAWRALLDRLTPARSPARTAGN